MSTIDRTSMVAGLRRAAPAVSQTSERKSKRRMPKGTKPPRSAQSGVAAAPEPQPLSETSTSSQSELFVALYGELTKSAAWQLRSMPAGHALQPTALVHEAFIKLQRAGQLEWTSRAHFFAIAVKAMREVITDSLRRKLARKRRGELTRSDIELALNGHTETRSIGMEEFMDLDTALSRLERDFPEIADVVLMRFFGGFTMDEIAEMGGKSRRTIERRWRFARSWLLTEMESLHT